MSDLVNLVRRNVFQSSFVHILIVSREAGQWTTSKSSQTVEGQSGKHITEEAASILIKTLNSSQ
ncbi:hypothetical protein LIT25_28090 (plasmid) [Bacillus sp. F19]|nr:hypothetical protein LIT25_28090 [Bacillus sp. F19]